MRGRKGKKKKYSGLLTDQRGHKSPPDIKRDVGKPGTWESKRDEATILKIQ
jgi:hypothetical protein